MGRNAGLFFVGCGMAVWVLWLRESVCGVGLRPGGEVRGRSGSVFHSRCYVAALVEVKWIR